jgi:hypothetical protein
LPHRRDRLVRRLQEISDDASARIAARAFRYIEPAEMQKTLDLLKEYGGVKTDLPATAFYTNEFTTQSS